VIETYVISIIQVLDAHTAPMENPVRRFHGDGDKELYRC